ncbi:methylated-DNA--[protein]-cysteine S-methyltransferase [Enterococcus faecalis]
MKITTSIGTLWLAADVKGLTGVSFTELSTTTTNSFTYQAKKEILEYLAGQRTEFTVPLSFTTGTTFQRQVWQTLMKIPYGQTWSYLQVATALGKPKAVRAIGQANSKNPWPLIVPCHRVIGKNGQLVGYCGSNDTDALATKQSLLTLENKQNKKSH